MTLQRLLTANPQLVRVRLESPGDWLRDLVDGALEGYFKQPYLLWFVAENPIRHEKLPSQYRRNHQHDHCGRSDKNGLRAFRNNLITPWAW